MAAARRATANPLTAWLKSWAEFTWVKDTTRSPIRLPWVAINWAVTITLPVVLFYHRNTEPTPTVIGVVAVVWLLWTIIRASVVVPARNKATARVYGAIRGSHRLPTLTASRPVVDPNHLTITRWHGLADPWAGISTYTDGSKAATLAGRGLAEQDIERGIKPAKNKTVIFDWETAPQVQWTVVAVDDPRAKRRDTTRWINQVVEQLFPKARGALGLQMEWPDTDDPHGDVPAVITIDFGAAYSPDSSLINDIESQFDNQFRRGVAWLYDWTVTGTLTITAGDPDSSEAARQTLLRWWRTEVRTRAEKAFGFRNLGSYTLTVTDWDDTDTPTRMSVEFDGGSIDPDQTSTFLTSLDVAFDKAWPDRIWLDDWAFGHTTRCTLTAVPPTHEDALRKTEERRLRGAVAQKFTTGRGTTSQVSTEVDQWRTTETGTQKPTKVVINFGTLDVNSFKFRLDAETHLDSLYPDTGWAYQWDTGAGTVTLTEVPALPRSHLFPLPGTPDFDRIIEAAKTGVITFGTAKGGGEVFMDLNRVPHALVGGITRSGKSVMLTIPLMYALYLPDEYDLVVCDPKRTDFTWTAEFPNVRFAATTEEITAAVKWAQERMSHNQDLLNRYQREKVDYLHQMASEGKIPATDAPKRTLVFFDEMAAYFDPSKNEDVRVLQSEAQYALSQIMMMGAAMWGNVIGAAQNPGDQNLGTQIRELFGTRIGIGWMKGNMSTQVLGDNRAEKLDRENTPKGRGWVLTEGERDKLGQVWYLPKHAETIPWIDGAPEMPGVVEIVAARLFQLGYRRMEVPGPDGVMRYRWVKPDELAIEP